MSQMWDCQENRERIFRECKYQVVATDMLAAALPALERANLDADFWRLWRSCTPPVRHSISELRQAVSGRGCALPSD